MLDVAKKNGTDRMQDSASYLPNAASDLTPQRPPGEYPLVYWLNHETVAIDWFGEVTEDKCRFALAQLQQLTRERKPRQFFSDTSLATSYIPTIRRGAAEILMHLRAAGIHEMAAVFSSPSIRMFAAAVAFVTGLKLKSFERREDALRLLSSRYRWEN